MLEVPASMPLGSLHKVMPWPFALCDRQGRILHANDAFARLSEEPFESLVNKSLFARLSAVHADLSLKELIESAEIGAWHGKVRLPRLAGEPVVEALVQADPDQEGHVWVVVLENPVINGQMILSPRSELRLLQILMDHTLDYVYFTDIHGHFVITNRAFQRAMQTPYPGFEVGKSIADFVTRDTARWVAETDQEVLASLKPIVNHVGLFQIRDGGAHWLQITKMPVFDHNRLCIGLVSVGRDISEVRQTENRLREAIQRAEQANEAKGEFLANMSHEIRTPINGIIGMTELCLESDLAPDQQRYLDTVLSCSNTLLSLVNDVLDFSKIEAGQLDLESIDFDLREALEETVDQFVPMARERGLELAVKLDPALPSVVSGDPIRFRQIVNNLAGNAVKFTEEGEVLVSARYAGSKGDRVRVEVDVVDTGAGIAEDRLETIFDTFTQGDSSTTRKYGGTGLGLSICRKLAKMMNGDVSVSSAVGQGTTFTAGVEFGMVSGETEAAMLSLEELRGKRVLVVDDNLTNRQILEEVCRHWGLAPVSCPDGVKAIERMEKYARREEPFDLLLLDQQMPGLCGTDVASLVASRERLSGVKMIILTSSLTREERLRGERMGIQRFLTKPVKQSALREAILDVFGLGLGSPVSTSAPLEDDQNTSLRVLLAEDNPINQEVALQRLRRLGHEVTLAVDGQEAVNACREIAFDLVLMDVQMPRLDGLEATRKIREQEEISGRHTPIIAMTARAMQGDEHVCLEAGMDAYFTKPFRAAKLRQVLEQVRQAPTRTRAGGLAGPAYDPGSISEQLEEEDREDMMLAARMFYDNWERDFAPLSEWADQINYGEAQRFAHSLKGTAGLLRAVRLGQCAACLEDAARRHDADESATALRRMQVEAAVIREQLRSYLNR